MGRDLRFIVRLSLGCMFGSDFGRYGYGVSIGNRDFHRQVDVTIGTLGKLIL
jgi:hypothetical protein